MALPVFPGCPSFGFTKRADYSVAVVERSSGVRSVNRNWYYPLHTFSAVPLDNKVQDDAYRVARFWHAIGGQSGQFLFKDYTDYTSAALPSAAIAATDQPLSQTMESGGTWQMMKLYEDEAFLFQQQRLIQKPIQGTIIIADDGVQLTETTHYTIDYDTGLVDFVGSVSGELTWGGQFYVPVMFESTPEFVMNNYKVQSFGFALRELRLEQPDFAS